VFDPISHSQRVCDHVTPSYGTGYGIDDIYVVLEARLEQAAQLKKVCTLAASQFKDIRLMPRRW